MSAAPRRRHHMNSALTPREIQSRIRAGESVEDVARAAGVSVDELDGFAEPVLAERDHMSELARVAQARRDSGPTPQPLEQFINTKLRREGVPDGSILWGAFRREDQADRHWTIRISYRLDETDHQALFDFDPRGRFVTAENADARWLIDDQPPHRGESPVTRTQNPDAEPTIDLNDELAIVRAVQDDETPVIGDGSALQELYAAAASNDATSTGSGTDQDGLREVDGVYDIVPNPTSDMDVLYDMLAGFDEDSVHVYEGLGRPVSLGDGAVDTNESVDTDEAVHTSEDASTGGRPSDAADAAGDDSTPALDAALQHRESPDEPRAATPASAPTKPRATRKRRTASGADRSSAATSTSAAKPASHPSSADQAPSKGPGGRSSADKAKEPDKAPAKPRPAAAHQDSASGQEPLVAGDGSATQPAKKPTKRRKSHRATVPSWDEIMFGERRPDKD
ncbi:septation protein SepH [Propionibacterium freudenreichii]|uniref:septation protein SepH n=1 Tax=Propionibacterium freudenreichii TaxID=1744 RepID=UPI00215A8674|nr:septation protein SepH [Propionibacterium freudenreichii]